MLLHLKFETFKEGPELQNVDISEVKEWYILFMYNNDQNSISICKHIKTHS